MSRSVGRPKEDLSSLPEGWYNDVLELYKEGGSDAEIKALIYEWRGSFSNNLWERWMAENVVFYQTIKKGRKLRGSKRKKPTNKKHLEKLSKRRKSRKNEYLGKNKLIHSLRNLLAMHLKNRDISFSKRTFELLGYNKNQYIEHILSNLKEGMTIDNYGEWHVDHIKPVSLFDLSNPNDVRKCWELDNLQPLWAMDNLIKSNKYVSTEGE